MQDGWIETYGPWAVLAGGVLEGETVFLAAGYAVSQGYMDPVVTLLLAAAGGTLGDAGWFLLGRWNGQWLIRTLPQLQRLRARATLLLRRWGRAAAFLMRFAYGLRVILPVSVGAARFPLAVFLPFNVLGSVAFAAGYLLLGYFFGETVEEVLTRAGTAHPWILLALFALALVFSIRALWKRRTNEVSEVGCP